MNIPSQTHTKQPSKLKMSRGHQNPEPMDDYCEIVQLGRRGVRRCDVTVFYKSVGRGGK